MRTRTKRFITILLARLKKRLPHLKILVHFDIFDISTWTTDPDFGVPGIKALFVHFLARRTAGIEEEAVSQWRVFLDDSANFRKAHPAVKDAVGVMMALLTESTFRDLSLPRDVCDIALSLPFSTAIVEGTFSGLRVLDNYRTNGLSWDLLDDLITVCMNGPREMSIAKSEELGKIWPDVLSRRENNDLSKAAYPLPSSDCSPFFVLPSNMLS
jgi:hypothetical protein